MPSADLPFLWWRSKYSSIISLSSRQLRKREKKTTRQMCEKRNNKGVWRTREELCARALTLRSRIDPP